VAKEESEALQGTHSRLRLARWWHAATFVAGAYGLLHQLWIQGQRSIDAEGVTVPFSAAMRIWHVLSYFTIWSNMLVTVVAFLLMRDPVRRGSLFPVFRLASLSMITITGVIYALVLAQTGDPTGWQKVADETLHYPVPILAVVGFLLFGPRPRFSSSVLWCSLSIPLVWLAYTLVRGPLVSYPKDGETHHWYPYHFINVDDIGYPRTLMNIVGISLLLLATSWFYTLLDRKLQPEPIP
jgi:hypothetical protein